MLRVKKYLWLIVIYSFVAGNPAFANGGMGGTGVNVRKFGMGKGCPLLPK